MRTDCEPFRIWGVRSPRNSLSSRPHALDAMPMHAWYRSESEQSARSTSRSQAFMPASPNRIFCLFEWQSA